MPALECGLETYVAIAVAGKKREAMASSHVCRVACVSRTLIVCLDFLQARAHGHRHRGKPFWGSGTDACGGRKPHEHDNNCAEGLWKLCFLMLQHQPRLSGRSVKRPEASFFLLLQFTVAVILHCPCYIIAGTAFMSNVSSFCEHRSLQAPALKSRVSNQYPFHSAAVNTSEMTQRKTLKIRNAPVRLIGKWPKHN